MLVPERVLSSASSRLVDSGFGSGVLDGFSNLDRWFYVCDVAVVLWLGEHIRPQQGEDRGEWCPLLRF